MFLNGGVGEDSWEVPWTTRRSNQSNLKKISPEYSLEGPMLVLKLQYFGHLIQRTDSLEKTPMLVSRKCMFLGSLSRHNKDLEWWTLKPPWRVTALRSWIDRAIALRSWKDHVTALRQISVTALFYLEDSRKIHLWGVRARWSKDARRRAPQRAGEREREN